VTVAGFTSAFTSILFFGFLESYRRTSRESPFDSIVIRSGWIFASLYSPIFSPILTVIVSLSPFLRGLPGLTREAAWKFPAIVTP
jgi:hypothetical protein